MAKFNVTEYDSKKHDVSEPENHDVPVSEEHEVPESEVHDVPESEEHDVPESKKHDVPESEEQDVLDVNDVPEIAESVQPDTNCVSINHSIEENAGGFAAKKIEKKNITKENIAPENPDTKDSEENKSLANPRDESKKLENPLKKLGPLWISNISSVTRAQDLKKVFAGQGKVITSKILSDGDKYYGYVQMDSERSVKKCLDNLNGSFIDGQKVLISTERPTNQQNQATSVVKSAKMTSGESTKDSSKSTTVDLTKIPSKTSTKDASKAPSKNLHEHCVSSYHHDKIKRRLSFFEQENRRIREKLRHYEKEVSDTKKDLDKEQRMYQKLREQYTTLKDTAKEYADLLDLKRKLSAAESLKTKRKVHQSPPRMQPPPKKWKRTPSPPKIRAEQEHQYGFDRNKQVPSSRTLNRGPPGWINRSSNVPTWRSSAEGQTNTAVGKSYGAGPSKQYSTKEEYYTVHFPRKAIFGNYNNIGEYYKQ